LEIVVAFLAVLELVKQRQIHVSQEHPFGDIEISPGSDWKGGQDPELDLEFGE
jgi:chromatin segregation and condensation protein Rec8/ScpA/Scc1 (kleisin family)